MSHSSNIRCSEELIRFINKAKNRDGNVRAFKVTIGGEQLILDQHCSPDGTFFDDLEQTVVQWFNQKEPCFVLLRLDTESISGNYDWTFISWSPDDSNVRDKMLYASTKSDLKLNFKTNVSVIDLFATNTDDIISQLNPCDDEEIKKELLTQKERDLLQVKRDEALISSLSHSTINLPGVSFPLSDKAYDCLTRFKKDEIDYIGFSINMKEEIIESCRFIEKKTYKNEQLPDLMPDNQACYHLVRYRHEFNGEHLNSTVFIYWMPSSGVSIREKMLYSSCKAPFVSAIQDKDHFGIEITKRLETDDKKDLNPKGLMDELHPKEVNNSIKFEKPVGPSGKRGPRRIIKPQN